MSESHATGWASDSPTPAQLMELFAQIKSGRISKQRLQDFLRNGATLASANEKLFPFWKPDLEWYSQSLDKCHCGGTLKGQPIQHYNHAGGWWVGGFKYRQWLSVKCPKCKNEQSLTHLHVPGKATFEEQLVEEIRSEGHVTTFTANMSSEQLEAWLLGRN